MESPTLPRPSFGSFNSVENALALHRAGKLAEAEAAYREILAVQPGFARAHLNLGLCLMDAQRWSEAEDQFESFVAAHPENAIAWVNLGILRLRRDDLAAAESAFRRAIDLKPSYAEAYNNLGATMRARGEFDDALVAFRRAAELAPALDSARMNVGFGELLRGNLDAGWGAHELRLNRYPRLQDTVFAGRVRWHSNVPLNGKTLCITAEQGLGDTLQFLRYLPVLAGHGARVVLAIQRPLRSLVEGFPGVATIFTEGDPMPAFDFFCPLLSLPFEFGTTLESIPSVIPIAPDPRLAADWSHRLVRSTRRRRVGVVWNGNPQHENDRNRSIPLHVFANLLRAAPEIDFFSVQKHPTASDLEQFSRIDNLINIGVEFRDFSDTAAALESLDLTITVDTSVAHLAGTMNRPVWILLPHSPDWRWMLERNDRPWYTTATLFRQHRPGFWDDVIAAVSRKLAQKHPPV